MSTSADVIGAVPRVGAPPLDDLRAFVFDAGALLLLDQRALPLEEVWLRLTSCEEVAQAIEVLAVRGAPAIGGAAAWGMVLAARALADQHPCAPSLFDALARLRRTRPTAVNLFYGTDHMERTIAAHAGATPAALADALEVAARAYCDDDAKDCDAIGTHGEALFEDGDVVLTICHTGALATCGQGTALGVLKSAQRAGKRIRVVALETRPLLQGARLTAWECLKSGLDVRLCTDGMAAFALSRLGVTKAIAGADRIAGNGDTANKIGTFGLAVACAYHHVPFYIAAPTSTFDLALAHGDAIPIEERHPDEVIRPRGAQFAPSDVAVWNPAFDVTPAKLIAGIVTERGVWSAPFAEEERARLFPAR